MRKFKEYAEEQLKKEGMWDSWGDLWRGAKHGVASVMAKTPEMEQIHALAMHDQEIQHMLKYANKHTDFLKMLQKFIKIIKEGGLKDIQNERKLTNVSLYTAINNYDKLKNAHTQIGQWQQKQGAPREIKPGLEFQKPFHNAGPGS